VQMRSVLTRIARLPRRQQNVVALCIWSGLSYEEARPPSACRSGPSARAWPELVPLWRNSTALHDISRSKWSWRGSQRNDGDPR
jgi:hypothetical protein